MPVARTATTKRETAETQIELAIDLDGRGAGSIDTGIGFFDHMLNLWSRHSLIDLTVRARGDLHVDAHHTVEDVGIVLGRSIEQALGDKSGIRRYGQRLLPMDEALVSVAIDLSGRAHFAWSVTIANELLGGFNSTLAEEFWRAVAMAGNFNLHVVGHSGRNSHHVIEAVFKAVARALREAVEFDPRSPGIPSTKGTLDN